jgi:diguanylate cyclase (GGDEF)-like protein
MDRLIPDVTAALRGAPRVTAACHRVVHVVAQHTPAIIAALLHVQDHLRCVAATGSWAVFSSTPAEQGVTGRVYSSGRSSVITDIGDVDDYIPSGPTTELEICVPIPDPEGRPIGVLNVEWGSRGEVDPDVWVPLLEEIGRRLGARISQLGGPPTETRSEKMLRHALSMSSANELGELLARSLVAARDVSNLSTPLVLLPSEDGARAYWDRSQPTPLGTRLAELDGRALAAMAVRARRHGSSYTLGDPALLDNHGLQTLTKLGVKTMIMVPVGPGRDPDAGPWNAGGVLLVVDEEVSRPDPGTVNLLELLAAQAWTAVERLQNNALLQERATSDPLTGLRHAGPFGERLDRARPERTALLVIDIDRFKDINDAYGHLEGDRTLVDLARALLDALRSGDELYRIGGDEFAAVLEVTRPEEAVRIADRLVAAAREVGHSVSVGVAVQLADETGRETLRRADTALYEAKRAGRDSARVAYPLHIVGDGVTGATR